MRTSGKTWVAGLAMLGLAGIGGAEEAPKKDAVTREEFNDLKAKVEPKKEEDYVTRDEFNKLKDMVEANRFGSNRFLLTGYTHMKFESKQRSASSFDELGFNPIFLWKLDDHVFAEAELETGVDNTGTTLSLEIATMHFILNDYAEVGIGKFLTPFGVFRERLHPDWVNKLPDMPLLYGDDTNMFKVEGQYGVEIRGGMALTPRTYRFGSAEGPTKFNYVFYVSNGPKLVTDAATAGNLNFDNPVDNNNNKAVGGRVGVLPIPSLELGASFMEATVGAGGGDFRDVTASLRGYDVSYVKDSDLLKGHVDLRYEWAQADVSRVRNNGAGYGTAGGDFDNRRYGSYWQAAYRPSKIKDEFLSKLEGVVRYDTIRRPGDAPVNTDLDDWTLGMNYWYRPTMALKLSYMLDHASSPALNTNQFAAEVVVAF